MAKFNTKSLSTFILSTLVAVNVAAYEFEIPYHQRLVRNNPEVLGGVYAQNLQADFKAIGKVEVIDDKLRVHLSDDLDTEQRNTIQKEIESKFKDRDQRYHLNERFLILTSRHEEDSKELKGIVEKMKSMYHNLVTKIVGDRVYIISKADISEAEYDQILGDLQKQLTDAKIHSEVGNPHELDLDLPNKYMINSSSPLMLEYLIAKFKERFQNIVDAAIVHNHKHNKLQVLLDPRLSVEEVRLEKQKIVDVLNNKDEDKEHRNNGSDKESFHLHEVRLSFGENCPDNACIKAAETALNSYPKSQDILATKIINNTIHVLLNGKLPTDKLNKRLDNLINFLKTKNITAARII